MLIAKQRLGGTPKTKCKQKNIRRRRLSKGGYLRCKRLSAPEGTRTPDLLVRSDRVQLF